MSQCPFSQKKTENNNPDPVFTEAEMKKCPFMSKEEEKNKKTEEDSDDDVPKGGCPVMNKSKIII